MHDHIQAILFDLDGTLIDTTDLILNCFHHSWQNVCGFNHSRENLLQTFGTPLREAMCRLMIASSESADQHEEPDSESDLVDRLLTEYRAFNAANHDSMARPFAGTTEVLTELRRRGYKIAVVTSKGRELALRGLKLFSLDQLLDSAVFLEDTNFHKPRPEPILAALEKLSVSPRSAVYVGDSPHDIVAGRAAGVRSLAALWGPAPRLDLELAQPDYVADSIYNLLDIFKHREPASRMERAEKDVAGCQA